MYCAKPLASPNFCTEHYCNISIYLVLSVRALADCYKLFLYFLIWCNKSCSKQLNIVDFIASQKFDIFFFFRGGFSFY